MYDYANCRGYSNTAMAGTNGKRLTHSAAGKGVALGTDSYPQFGAHLLDVIQNDGTWTLIIAETGAIANSGTWSSGYPLAESRWGRPTSAR